MGGVPSEAPVDVDGEGAGEVEGGDAEAGGERLEGHVADGAHPGHLGRLRGAARGRRRRGCQGAVSAVDSDSIQTVRFY